MKPSAPASSNRSTLAGSTWRECADHELGQSRLGFDATAQVQTSVIVEEKVEAEQIGHLPLQRCPGRWRRHHFYGEAGGPQAVAEGRSFGQIILDDQHTLHGHHPFPMAYETEEGPAILCQPTRSHRQTPLFHHEFRPVTR